MMSTATDIAVKKIWSLLEQVNDPEIPVLTITDLGIVRAVNLQDENVEIVVTPTYSGCPAMLLIEWEIRARIVMSGYERHKVKVTTVLSPAWTTDWMSEAGKQKLQAYGIAPPRSKASVCGDISLFAKEEAIPCPRCHSYHTTLVSQFGSTACKAHYRCEDCKEPFDYFKCH